MKPAYIDLSLPLRSGGPNANAYYADELQETTIEMGSFVGAVARGGSVNYRKLSMTPHGNGTHTECYGHISDDPTANIYDLYHPAPVAALLVSVTLFTTKEGDQQITLADVQAAYNKILSDAGLKKADVKALIIRSLPNAETKRTAHHSGKNPPYPEPGMGQWLVDQGIEHWVLDVPSADREQDEGKLQNHKGFWQVSTGKYKNVAAAQRKHCTITELAYVPQEVPDGAYQLLLAPIPLLSDAAPSRVLIWKA